MNLWIRRFLESVRAYAANEEPRSVPITQELAAWDAASDEALAVTEGGCSCGSLCPQEIAHVLAGNASHCIVGCWLNRETETVVVVRIDGSTLSVPKSFFTPSGVFSPDFERLSVVDFGNTLKLGEYECSVDAILYQFDEKYRKNADELRKYTKDFTDAWKGRGKR